MSRYLGPELLADAHHLDDFDCGDEALNEWFRRRASRNHREGSSRTWVVTEEARVVAFYASSTAVLTRTEATKRAARNQPDPLPAMLLGRLAVDREHHGQGLAAALLKHFLLKALEVAQLTGVRLVLVHAKNEHAANFYHHYGFDPSLIDDLTLMLLIKDIHSLPAAADGGRSGILSGGYRAVSVSWAVGAGSASRLMKWFVR